MILAIVFVVLFLYIIYKTPLTDEQKVAAQRMTERIRGFNKVMYGFFAFAIICSILDHFYTKLNH